MNELKQQIEQEAKSNASSYGYFPGSEEDEDLQSAYITGATTYATRAITAEHDLSEAKKLLNEVFRKHESGLLPDRFVYEKIKDFLYPEINKTNGTE